MDQYIEKALIKCGLPDEMRMHIGARITLSQCQTLIARAPIPLEEKKQLLQESTEEIDRALNATQAGVFYLFMEWYDTDVFIEKSSGMGLFQSLDEVMTFISNELKDEDSGDLDTDTWFRIELWRPDSDPERSVLAYEYYTFKDEICWFNKMVPDKDDNGNIYYRPESRKFSAGRFDLNLSTPYKTGDIVKIDCRPFGPTARAVVLEDDAQFDCCMPTIVFRVPFTDRWRVTALKHRRFYADAEMRSYEPMLSPLYRLKKVPDEELQEEDDMLRRLSEYVRKDPTKAKRIWERISDDVSEVEMEKLLDELAEGRHEA